MYSYLHSYVLGNDGNIKFIFTVYVLKLFFRYCSAFIRRILEENTFTYSEFRLENKNFSYLKNSSSIKLFYIPPQWPMFQAYVRDRGVCISKDKSK